MKRAKPWIVAILLGGAALIGGPLLAQEAPQDNQAPGQSPRPRLRPPEIIGDAAGSNAELANPVTQPIQAPPAVDPTAAPPSVTAPQTAVSTTVDLSKGAVTNLPIPRYVSLKGGEGNARRGPGLTNRIDWVFTTSGMPLRITAEHENWRRVEDAEGMGGWVHYSLLSGVRSVLITVDMAEFFTNPDPKSAAVFQAEMGVIGRLMECQPEWCRVNVQGEKGWVQKTSLWGVDPEEVTE